MKLINALKSIIETAREISLSILRLEFRCFDKKFVSRRNKEIHVQEFAFFYIGNAGGRRGEGAGFNAQRSAVKSH